jgi:SAM-dependent methyltransferase
MGNSADSIRSTQEIFEDIYRRKLWGGKKFFWRRFYSGSGSIGRDVVGPYLKAVAPLILDRNVVDLGCGDFNVGKHLAKLARQYVGCDIVRPLIERNRRKFSDVDFQTIDAVEDILPDGDIVLVRQVLQHLNNKSVSKVLDKLTKYHFAIVTEHIPVHEFVPNIDMPTGPGNRMQFNSGLVLSEPPFCFPPGKVLCEVAQHRGLIRTILHQLSPALSKDCTHMDDVGSKQ